MRRLSLISIFIPYVLLVIEVWVKYPHNHGGGPRLYIVLGVIALVLNVCYMLLSRRLAPIRMIAIGLLAILLYACDRFNILVEYERWGERGLPDWGTWQR